MPDLDFSGIKPAKTVYLVHGAAHVPYQSGKDTLREREFFWCGPQARAGSGVVTHDIDPYYDGVGRTESPTICNWESRLSRGKIDTTLGNLKQRVQALSQVTFSVAIEDGREVSRWDEERIPDDEDLRLAVLEGRWTNKPVKIWLYDLEQKTSRLVAVGFWDRDPTNVGGGRFSMTINFDVLPPEEWPVTVIPPGKPATWTATGANDYAQTGVPVDYYAWFPHQWQIPPDLEGATVGPVFGVNGNPDVSDSRYNQTHWEHTGGGIWRELVPYGKGNAAEPNNPGWTAETVFCHVAPIPGCWVSDIYYVDNDGEVIDLFLDQVSAPYFVATFLNLDPSAGPIGTNCKFSVAPGHGSGGGKYTIPNGTDAANQGGKVYGRIFGQGFARFPSSGPNAYSPNMPFYGYAHSATATPTMWGYARSRFEEIIEDIFQSPDYLGMQNVLGTGALAAFDAAAPDPTTSATDLRSWREMSCAVPTSLTEKIPTYAEVIGDLLAYIPADLVIRYDPALRAPKLFPIWRGPVSTRPIDWIFTHADLLDSSTLKGIKMMDDPDGTYCNEMEWKRAEFKVQGRASSTLSASIPGVSAEVSIDGDPYAYVQTDAVEQAYERFGMVKREEVQAKWWTRWRPKGRLDAQTENGAGHRLAGQIAFRERAQKQMVIEATFGWTGYKIQMGDVVQYQIPGIWDHLGMVRKIRYDLDSQTVRVTSYHLEKWGQSPREDREGLESEGFDRQTEDRKERQERRSRVKSRE